jgi:hypothetical protein
LKSLAAVMMSVVSMEFSPSLCVRLCLQKLRMVSATALSVCTPKPKSEFPQESVQSFGMRMGGKPSAIQRRDHHSEMRSLCGVQGGDS